MAALDEIIQRSKTTPPPSNNGQSSSALSGIIQRTKSPTPTPLSPPPDPGADLRSSATSQARSSMGESIRESVRQMPGGPIRTPDPLSETLGLREPPSLSGIVRGERDQPTTAGKVVDFLAPQQFDPADLISPMGGATQRAAKGVGSWFLRRWGLGGFVDDAAEQAGKVASEAGGAVSRQLSLPPASGETYGNFPMQTATADIEVAPHVTRKQTPPSRYVPPSHQLPSATQQMPAATLPEAYRAPVPEQIGTREMSLDDVRSRIALLEGEQAANPLQRAQIQQELGELRAYQEPQQLEFPIPEPSGRQGELWTNRAVDVAPESKVYGAGPEDPARSYAQGELRRAEEASSRTLPKTPSTPKAYKPNLQSELESIGFEVAPASKQSVGGSVLLSQPSAISSYPALKTLSKRISSARLKEAEIQRELTTLSQSAPTPANITRTEKLQQQLDSIAQSRTRKQLTAADEDEILRTVQRMEDELPRAELGAAEYAAKTAKARRMTRQQAVESIDESIRGPEFAPPLQPKEPTGGVIPRLPRSGLREPPTGPATPDKFSATPAPKETVKAQGALAGLRMPQENLRYVGGGASRIADSAELGLAEGRLKGSLRFHQLRRAGLLDLDEAESLNVTEVLQSQGKESQGKVKSVSERVTQFVKVARRILDEIAQEIRTATPSGESLLVRSPDGSMQIFTPLKGYFPHHIPALSVLKDSKSVMRAQILDASVSRGEFASREAAEDVLADYVKYADGKTDKPSKLLAYFHKNNPHMSERQVLNLMQQLRSGKPGKYGALEQHRTLDLPFYDPSAKRALDYYVRHASERAGLTRRLGQEGEVITKGLRDIENSLVQDGSKKPEDVAKFVSGEVDKLLGQVDTDKYWDAISASHRIDQAFKIGPMTSIANSLQATMFGPVKTDVPTMLRAWGKLFSKAGRERALSAGADIEQAIKLSRLESGFDEANYLISYAREMKEAGLHPIKRKYAAYRGYKAKIKGDILSSYMHYNSFAHSELMQRVIGHGAGEVWVDKMAKRLSKNPNDTFALNEMRGLNLEPEKIIAQGGKLTDEQALLAGASMSNMINFSSRPEHLMSAAQGPGARTAMGKMLLQFKTFGVNAAKLSYEGTFGNITKGLKLRKAGDAAGNEYLRRGTKNMLYMATVFPAGGELVGTVRALLTQGPEAVEERYGKDWEEKIAKRWLLNAAEVGAFGMVMDTFRSAGYGKLAEVPLGPTIGKEVELGETVAREFQKMDPDSAVKNLTKWGIKNSTMTGTLLRPYLQSTETYPYDKQGSGGSAGRQGRANRSGRGDR